VLFIDLQLDRDEKVISNVTNTCKNLSYYLNVFVALGKHQSIILNTRGYRLFNIILTAFYPPIMCGHRDDEYLCEHKIQPR
jgi:hypothetical protein